MQGPGSRVKGSGFRVLSLGFRVWGAWRRCSLTARVVCISNLILVVINIRPVVLEAAALPVVLIPLSPVLLRRVKHLLVVEFRV